MKISKIRVQNYKLLKDVCVEINQDINVLSGKMILEIRFKEMIENILPIE